MDKHIDVGRGVHNGTDTRMMGKGIFVDSEEGPAGLSLGDEALRHDISLLERSFSVLHPEGADAAVSVKGYGLSSVEIIGSVVVWILHHLIRTVRYQCFWEGVSLTNPIKGTVQLLWDLSLDLNVLDFDVGPEWTRNGSKVVE